MLLLSEKVASRPAPQKQLWVLVHLFFSIPAQKEFNLNMV
jgi:hypothetical protein